MPKADQFIVQNNIVLAFESRGKQYKMKILVEDGMILLYELQGNEENDLKVWFLGEEKSYTGEASHTYPYYSSIQQETSPAVTPKKRKRSKKKKATS